MEVQVIQNLTIFFILIRFSVGEGQEFSNCSRRFSCGFIRDIGYPFWGGDRPPECGSRRLRLSCRRYNYTTIDIGEDAFLVVNININNNTMTLARMDLLNDVCPEENLGWISNSPFQYTPSVQNLTLFYSCSSPTTSNRNNFSCIINGTNLVAVIANESFPGVQVPNRRSRCELTATIPVLKSALEEYRRNSTKTLQEVVNEGFEVKYQIDADGSFPSDNPTQTGKKKKKELQELMTLEDCTETFDSEHNGIRGHDLKLFSYASILASTNSFATDNKLGEGGFGPVYKGKLSEGHEIAVKLLSRRSEQGLLEFKTELVLMSKLQHRNLVKLLGFCIHGNDKLIVYDYVPNKSLDFFLFDPAKREQLNWDRRFKIIEGITQGLLYLHKYSRIAIIHRDLKASNILLDEIMNPKISDFGLARIFKHNVREANTNKRAGTYGYMAPEYVMNGVYSVKSDIYSFGVITLEIVSGQRNNSFHDLEGPLSLVQFAWELWEQGAELELMDPKLNALSCNMKDQVRKCIHVGLLCVQNRAADRPAIEDAVSMLKNETKSLPMPGKPAFFVRDDGVQKTQKLKLNKFSMNEISLSAMDGR